MEEKQKKQNEEKDSSGTNIDELEIKRHEVESLTDQLESMQVEQKQVFLVIFQVKIRPSCNYFYDEVESIEGSGAGKCYNIDVRMWKYTYRTWFSPQETRGQRSRKGKVLSLKDLYKSINSFEDQRTNQANNLVRSVMFLSQRFVMMLTQHMDQQQDRTSSTFTGILDRLREIFYTVRIQKNTLIILYK